MALTDKPKREIATLVIVFTSVLVVSALVVYLIAGRTQTRTETETSRETQTPVVTPREPAGRDTVEPTLAPERRAAESPGFFEKLFGTAEEEGYDPRAHWTQNVGKIAFRLFLAALLGAALAFRPRQRILALKRNPYVSQTQILLAIVAAALMIIVGDNAARAFGIFAAVSLVRFRTNIRDPKEITVLLIMLALGIAAGVGRWDLALVLAVFSLLVLYLLEWREPQLVFRSLDVKVSTRNVVATQQALRSVFHKHGFDTELRTLNREVSVESPGVLTFAVDVSPMVSTDELSEEILSIDGAHVEAIEWDQKKNYSYLYQ